MVRLVTGDVMVVAPINRDFGVAHGVFLVYYVVVLTYVVMLM